MSLLFTHPPPPPPPPPPSSSSSSSSNTISCYDLFGSQNHWVFGLCPSSGILETTKHNVSETGSVSVLR
jgi:hypothetical protein